MAGKTLMSILPAKKRIEEWRWLRACLFLSDLRSFHNLFLRCFFLLCLFQFAERMEGSLTDLIRERERIPTEHIDMIIPQWGEAFNILLCNLHPSCSHLL